MQKSLVKTLQTIGVFTLAAAAVTGCPRSTDNSDQLADLSAKIDRLAEQNVELRNKLNGDSGDGVAAINSADLLRLRTDMNTEIADLYESDTKVLEELSKIREQLENAPSGGGMNLTPEERAALLEEVKADLKQSGSEDIADAAVEKIREQEEAERLAREEAQAAERAEREAFMKDFTEELQTEYPELDPDGNPMQNFQSLMRNYGTDETVRVMGRFFRAARFRETNLPEAAIRTIEDAERAHTDARIDTYRRLEEGLIDEETAKLERENAQEQLDATLESSLTPEELEEYENTKPEGMMGQLLSNPEAAIGRLDQMSQMFGGNNNGDNQ